MIFKVGVQAVLPFSEQAADEPEHAIPYDSRDYLELVDWSCRAISKASGAASRTICHPILERLKIDPDNYIRFINRTPKHRFHNVIGAVDSIRDLADKFGRTFLKGQTAAAALFSPG